MEDKLIITDGKRIYQGSYVIDYTLVTQYFTLPVSSMGASCLRQIFYTGRESMWANRLFSLRKGVSRTA